MASLGSHFLKILRRTTRPYEVQVRTVLGFNLFLLLLFLIITAVRYAIAQECPDVLAHGITRNAFVQVAAACPAKGWGAGFTVSILDNLAAALIVALLTSWLVWLMSPKSTLEESIQALDPWNIRPALLSPLSDTRRYHYRGRSGRFLRATVIPELFKAGKLAATRRELFLLLPDPTVTRMLDEYAHYRNSIKSPDGHWDRSRIQAEIVATILFTAFYHNANQFFEAHVYLKSDFSLFRMDMSEQRLILTREDESWPGIICSAQSKFYASYEEEFHVEAKNGTLLTLGNVTLPVRYTDQDVNPALAALGIQLTVTPDQANEVVKAMRKPKVPYA